MSPIGIVPLSDLLDLEEDFPHHECQWGKNCRSGYIHFNHMVITEMKMNPIHFRPHWETEDGSFLSLITLCACDSVFADICWSDMTFYLSETFNVILWKKWLSFEIGPSESVYRWRLRAEHTTDGTARPTNMSLYLLLLLSFSWGRWTMEWGKRTL